MKTIKLDIAYDYFGGVYRTALLANPPSKSFLKQARIALTEQLSELIEDPICRARLADVFVKQDFEDAKQDIGTLNRTLTKQVFRLPRAV